MERICTACLSVDRKLYTLKDLKFFYDLLIPDNEYNLPEVQICWECRNTLRKCMQFQRMALTAKDFLNSQSLDPKFYNKQDLLTKSHSNLTTALKTDFDYKYTYKEPSIEEYCDIKQEYIASICCKNQKPDVNLCCTKLEPDIETYDEPLNPVKLEVSLETPFPSPIILDDVVSLPSPSVPNLVSKTPQKVFIEPVYQKIGAPKIKTIIAVPNNQMPKQRQKPQSSRAVVNKLAKLSPELVVKFKGESQRIFLNTQRALKEHKTAVKSRKSSTGTPKEKSANIPKNIKQAEELTTEAAKSDEEMELPRTKFPESDEEMELPRTKSPESDEEMELPTTAEIYQSFLATLTEEYKKNFKVIVMSKKEMLSYRKKMSEKSQYVCSTYKCTDCILGFNSEQELGDHRTAIHTESEDGSTRECLTCHAYVPSNRFAFHYGRHRVLYQCVWCEHSFADVAEVLTHDHDMQFKWGVCGSKLSSKQRQKFRKVYHIDQISTCDICGERFTTKAFLKRHVNRHYAGNEESTKCKICNTDYKDKYTFAAHIKKLHSFSEVKICWECRNTLRKCDQFQKNAVKAIDFLTMYHYEINSYSTLCTSLQTDFDYKYTYEGPIVADSSCSPRIKQESDLSPRCGNQESDQSPCSIKLESDIEMYGEPLIRAKQVMAVDHDKTYDTYETYDEPLVHVKLKDGLPNHSLKSLSEVLQSLEGTVQNSNLVQSYQMSEPLAKQTSVTKLTKSAPERKQLTIDQNTSKKKSGGTVTQVISKAQQDLEPNEPVAKNLKDQKYAKCYEENIQTTSTEEICDSFLTTLSDEYKKSFKTEGFDQEVEVPDYDVEAVELPLPTSPPSSGRTYGVGTRSPPFPPPSPMMEASPKRVSPLSPMRLASPERHAPRRPSVRTSRSSDAPQWAQWMEEQHLAVEQRIATAMESLASFMGSVDQTLRGIEGSLADVADHLKAKPRQSPA